jgi:hypothetical protein
LDYLAVDDFIDFDLPNRFAAPAEQAHDIGNTN